jgi:hypothetical protein
VIYSIYRTYPYTIVNDKYLYTQEEGDILKNNITLKSKGRNAANDRSFKRGHCKSKIKQTKKRQSNFLAASFFIVLIQTCNCIDITTIDEVSYPPNASM